VFCVAPKGETDLSRPRWNVGKVPPSRRDDILRSTGPWISGLCRREEGWQAWPEAVQKAV
jgi:hypothetical protein